MSGPTAQRTGYARAPARRTRILNGVILHRPWMSIRMSLVYAIAKKAIGLMVNVRPIRLGVSSRIASGEP